MPPAELATAALAIRRPRASRQKALAEGLRTITMLALCAASIFLFVWELTDERAIDFMRQNVLRQIARRALFRNMVLAAAGTAAVTIGYLVLGREGRRMASRVARLAAPAALAGMLPPLLVRNTWDPLSTVVAITAVILCFERLLRSAVDETSAYCETAFDPLFTPFARGRRRAAVVAVALCAAFYVVYMSSVAVFAHRRFAAHGFELAQYDNVFWNTLHGRPFQCGPLGLVRNWQYLGYRAEFSLPFFLPFYAVKPGPETLLVLRALASAVGAIAVHRFASRRIPASHAAVLAICYLLYPPLHALNFEAFSLASLSIPFVLFAVDFADEKRWILSAVAAAVAIGCGSEMSLDLALIGIFLVLAGYRSSAGAALAMGAMSYFVLATSVVVPGLRAAWPEDAFSLGSGPGSVQNFDRSIGTIFSSPTHTFQTFLSTDKLGAFLQLMAPVALLPLRRAYLLPALAPLVLFAVGATGMPGASGGALAAPQHVVPFVFLATAIFLASSRSGPRARSRYFAALAALVAGTLLSTIHFGAFPPRPKDDATPTFSFERPTGADERKAQNLADLVAMVPEGATFVAGDAELSHVAGRAGARSSHHDAHADYVVYGESNGGADAAKRAIDTGESVEVGSRPGLVLVKRKR